MTKLRLVPEIYCTNIDETKFFYLEVLGFKIKYERPEENFVRFTLDGVDIMALSLLGDDRRWVTGEMEKPFGRGVNFQWDIGDIDGMYSRVKVGSPESIYMEIETKAYQCGDESIVQKQFIAQDPDGYLLRFCSDHHEIT